MTNERFLKMVTIEGEVWKDVPGYEGEYMVSTIGKVLFVGRYIKNTKGAIIYSEPHLITWRINKDGYAQVDLWKSNKSKRMYVHRLVALAFLDNSNNYPCIDHIDTDRLNNNLENLRWCSYSMNGLNPLTREHFRQTCKNIRTMGRWIQREVIGINIFNKDDIRHYSSVSESKKDGFNPSQVSACCRGRRNSHKGFMFYYLPEYENLISKSKSESIPQEDYQHPQPQPLQPLQLPLQFEP